MTNQEYMAQAWKEYDNLPFRINMNFIEGWHSGDVSDLVNSICQTPASVMLAIAGETEEESAPIQSVRRAGKSRHDKKAARRKGSVKRFRDRSRKCAHEEHLYKVYNRGLVGDWNRRGRRLEDAGQVAFKTSQRLIRDIEVDPEVQDEEETRTFTYTDGFTLSMSMSKSAWEKEEEDDFSPSFNWDRKYAFEQINNDEDWLDDDDWVNWEEEWDNEDDDEIIDAPDPKKPSSSYDTSEFTAIELAQMSMKLACAAPDQRACIREFMKTL